MWELLAPVLAPALGALGGIRFVREGERAIMLRFDKAVKRGGEYKVIKPGLRFMIPSIHKLARIHVRQRTINYPMQTIVLSDDTVFNVSAILLCKVRDTAQDLYNALFETTGINGALTDYGLLVIRDVLSSKTYRELLNERPEIAAELRSRIQERADQWGVEVIQFELSDCDPNPETARLIQISAQVNFRVSALEEAAGRLGTTLPQLSPNLAAVLVGMPMVATPGPDNHISDSYDKR